MWEEWEAHPVSTSIKNWMGTITSKPFVHGLENEDRNRSVSSIMHAEQALISRKQSGKGS